jgi:trimeric autotransporter adhesin
MNSNCGSRRVCAAFVIRAILGITAVSALAACNGQSSSDAFTGSTGAISPAAAAPAAPTVSLQADESSVAMGSPVTLQWKASNAQSCTASGGWSGTVPTAGTMTTPPLTGGTSFTLACTGSGGTAAQSVDVVVGAPANASVAVTLTATPTTVSSGGNSTLNWKSVGATACTASGGWHGSVATSGTWSTGTLTNTTEYELTCTGASGSATQSATVTVSSLAPVVTLAATPSTVDSGAPSSLTWSSSNATSCSASGGWSGSKGLSGSQSTGAVAADSTYSLTCTGPGGNATQSAMVSVNSPLPNVRISAAPSSVASGTSTMLTWSATHATGCMASGAWSGSKVVWGSESTGVLTNNATYTLTCHGAGGSAAQSTTVSVKASAPTVTLSAGPSAVKSGSSATLTWSSTNATSCVASGAWSGAKAVTGTQSTGSLTSNSTYTLTCNGAGGTAAQGATVTVSANPKASVSFSASPSTISSGGSSTLTWTSNNATSCTASGAWSGAKALTGSQSTGALTANSTYTLTCTGTGGSAAQSATVSVSQPAPTVSLSASPSTVASGSSSTLSWSASNATSCTASGGWSGTKAMSGSQSMGALTSNTTYTLNCTGTGGSAAQSATVSVTQPKPIVTLSASPSTVASGGSSTLSWSTTNATSCTASGAWSGAKGTTGGSQSTGALTANQSYTLTCTGAGGSAAQSATVSVTTPAPAVTLTASPTTVKSGAASALTWSSTNATACTASGGWAGSESTAGSQTTAALTATTKFTLTCSGAGGSAAQSATVTVTAPAPTVSLAASPTSVASGGASTLTWTSTNATTCTASGGWTGSEPTAGSQSTAALAATTNFTLTCTGTGGSASQSASVTVNGAAALAITSPSTLTVATKGAAYSYTMAASGGTPPYTWSLVSDSGSSNTWNVSGAGAVSGTPSVTETDSLVIMVTDSVGKTAQGTFSVAVAANGPLAIITPAALPSGTIGSGYSTTVQASGGTPPYTWALLSNSSDLLSSTPGSQATPANNAYSVNASTGVLSYSGNLAGAENDYFYVQVTDSATPAHAVVAKEFAMNVSSSNNRLVIATPANLGDATQGAIYTSGAPLATLTAVGNAASVTWSITAQTTTGATSNTWSINSSTGAITGTATNVGINTLTVQATDGTNTATQYYNVGVYQYVTGAPRPSYNPSSGTSPGTNIPVGPGFFVLNGELYEPNGNLFHQVGANSQYGDVNIISNPWMDALKVNAARNFINGLGGTAPSKAGEAGYANWYNTYWLDTHRTVNFVRAYDWSTTMVSGSTVLGTTSGGHAGMGTLLSEWVTQQSVYAPYMNKITITIANEYGPYSQWGATFGQVYTAVSAPITGLNGTTLTFSGTSHFNSTNAGGGIGYIYIKGATWSGANNDGLYAVSANGTNTLTGTFPSGYVSGGTVWAGAVGILRAAGYYCPLVIDSPGGQGYEDVVNYGPAIVQSDPLKNIIFSYHLYANQDNNNTQAQFESGILTPLNTLRNTYGAAIVVDEVGIYAKDQGNNGTANGGDETAFPSSQQLQSFGKYGVSYFHWLLNTIAPESDTNGGNIPGMRYNNSSSQSSATDAGYPSQVTVFGKHTFLDPIRGDIANFPGYATSF